MTGGSIMFFIFVVIGKRKETNWIGTENQDLQYVKKVYVLIRHIQIEKDNTTIYPEKKFTLLRNWKYLCWRSFLAS
jgi:hypothetical protein